jgi:hypothetical protein
VVGKEGRVNALKNVDLAPMGSASSRAQSHVIFLENVFDELRPKCRWGNNVTRR